MRMMPWILVAALSFGDVFLFLGCMSRIDWTDPRAIASHIRVEPDTFRQLTAFIGPNCAQEPLFDMLLLRAWKSSEGSLQYQIYVADHYYDRGVRAGSGWRFYSAAADIEGTPLEARSLGREVDSCDRGICSYIETIGLTVTRTYLEDRKDRGITFKLMSRTGDAVFSIPAPYVRAFLAATL